MIQWVRTSMGTENADLELDVASEALLDRILQVSREDNGKFFDTYIQGWKSAMQLNSYDGKLVPY